MARIDIEAVLQEVTDRSPGWRKAAISFGVPAHGQRPGEGLASPDGLAWEVTYRTQGEALSPTVKKHLAEHAARQRVSGYDCRLVYVDGGWSFVERMAHGTGLRLWDGLRLTGEWEMNGPCPHQGTVTALWTKPAGRGTEEVTLYIRHRDYSLDPGGTVWSGVVQRHDGKDVFAAPYVPWSPNLLPELAPKDAPPLLPGSGIGSFLFHVQGLPPPVNPDVGFLEDALGEAQASLLKRAEAWLREHGETLASWEILPISSSGSQTQTDEESPQ